MSLERDYNGDRNVDYRETSTYNANGNLLSIEKDTDADGNVDSKETYTYDVNGNRLSYDIDRDADGRVNYREIYTYDANGNRLSAVRGISGTPYYVTSTYDANEIIQTRTTLENNSGSKTLEKYDSFGNKIFVRSKSPSGYIRIETTTWKGF